MAAKITIPQTHPLTYLSLIFNFLQSATTTWWEQYFMLLLCLVVNTISIGYYFSCVC